MRLVFRDVDVDGARRTVEVCGGVVTRVAADLGVRPAPGAVEIDGHGGALLPGLHDHHMHLLAAAARTRSVDCTRTSDEPSLVRALRAAPGEWIRATGYHESTAGRLDRRVLDRWVPDRPLRVQHISGALWILNSCALEKVDHVLDGSSDVERDANGSPNGRLWRFDRRLAPALPSVALDLAAVGSRLSSFGLTGVTDATPDLASSSVDLLGRAVGSGELPLSVHLLGATEAAAATPGLSVGATKIVVEDHDLPDVDTLTSAVQRSHDAGRAVAVHTVSADSLAITVEALRRAGGGFEDRLEHAAVVLPGFEDDLRSLGVTVVTQPAFVSAHGDRYLREVDGNELPYLYRYATLLTRDIPVVASSDAPFGPDDPWDAIRTATTRRTAKGVLLGANEAVTPRVVLGSYLRDPAALHRVRRVVPGAPADLCLLREPLARALAEPSAEHVRLTVSSGTGMHRVTEPD